MYVFMHVHCSVCNDCVTTFCGGPASDSERSQLQEKSHYPHQHISLMRTTIELITVY